MHMWNMISYFAITYNTIIIFNVWIINRFVLKYLLYLNHELIKNLLKTICKNKLNDKFFINFYSFLVALYHNINVLHNIITHLLIKKFTRNKTCFER